MIALAVVAAIALAYVIGRVHEGARDGGSVDLHQENARLRSRLARVSNHPSNQAGPS